MNAEPTVLIVDPLLGSAGLMGLAGKLHAAVEVAEIGDLHASMPCVLAAGVTARLQRDPRVWDWAISVREGASVAAQMVSRGQAKRAVLMDPLVGFPELPGCGKRSSQICAPRRRPTSGRCPRRCRR